MSRLQSVAELAKAMGKCTGVVTSVEWSDATPATPGGAHSSWRYNNRDIANEMLSDGTLDVIMGTGHPFYDANGAPRQPIDERDFKAVGGWTTWDQLCRGEHPRGWKLVQRKDECKSSRRQR